ncbi:MAG TPA: transposase zinc-binding domain-containing protein [Planctomycetota bacterium]|nr:transposase zinc-binding domain-containing protein [Planctomycetota bacterium]HOE86663.1 transposase zinc-binding domain-containing protein [Planctomycetota bacterium]HOR67408.1 transposase zinc-binding domain-containing protein [Planctomycetota bacterium]HPL60160.1 transposase zinc-binding domain-containing protein [Planctomycetota bacterium]HPY70958.1 transposase zinc-binding domain-containing protein [Planctomycetota bacterium]
MGVRFEGKYGPWRPHWRRVLAGFLACGDLACGFARVRCPDCRLEHLVPFSCKRKLCPSCEARRRAEWSAHVVEEVLPDLTFRQLVFTVPRVLRGGFMRERWLLGELVRTAYDVTRRFLTAQFPGVKRAVPYFAGAVET